MAEFKLGRIKFVWKNTWTTATVYYVDDIVRVGGRSYVCVVGHTASADFNTDLEAATSKWNLFSSGNNWRGEWTTSTLYQLGDLVKYGGNVYNCNDSHTSAATAVSGLESDQAKWDTFVAGLDYRSAWTTSTRYKINDLVRYGGITYVCDTGHTSAASDSLGLEDNQASWTSFNEGIEYKGTWSSSSVRYKINDVVKYGGGTWICVTQHTSSATFSSASFEQFAEGIEYEAVWSSGTVYQVGDIVSFGGNQYIALQLHSAQTPSTATAYWSLFSEGFDFQSDWNSGTAYKIGQVVRLNGYTYLATADSTAQEPPNVTYWQRLNYGIYWRGEWENSTAYKAGDAVRFQTNTFICILAHTSADDDSTTAGDVGRSPATDTTGTYWNALTLGSELSPLSVTGDLVYYGGAGPTRLPIGTTGQVLKVSSGGIPEWDQFWGTDHVYYVKTTGVDIAYPEGGGTLDTAWKTIRYACEQVERGPRYPDARYLLELNRVFIQREVTEFIQRQITTNTAPFTSAFVYDDFKCERDVGFTLDAVIYDLCHGGNVKSRGVANSLIGGLSEGETEAYPGLAIESDESVAAYNYMLTVVGNVLAQTAPTINYQTLNGDNSTATVSQYFNSDLTAEANALTTVTASVTLITDAITARAAAVTAPQIAAAIASVPARRSPSNLIKIATGQYRETLPIIVPEQTCVIGDELRSTNAGPAGSLTNRSDAGYSVGALTRLETVVGQIILGTNVTESSGNTTTQSIAFPYASTDEAADAAQLVRVMQHQIDYKISSTFMVSNTDPTGYNSAYLVGYGDARTLIKENKEFIKDEIIAYITENYPTVRYSRTICKRDTAFIVDAMVYDLTYGGFTQTLNAGLAYFDGTTGLEIDASEVIATVAAYGRLKTVMQQIAANTTVTKSTGNAATQWTDATNLTGGAAASSFIGANIDNITNLLAGDSTAATPPIVTVTSITGTNTFVTAGHSLEEGDLVVPIETQNGLTAGTRYYVSATGLTATEFRVATYYAGGTQSGFTNGSGLTLVMAYEDRPVATNAVTTTTSLRNAFITLQQQVSTIVTAMTAYIAANFPTLVYNSAKCERDAKIILDAVGYDFMFAANGQTRNAALAYLRASSSDVYSLGQKAATRAAFTYVKGLAKANVGGDATAQARIETLMTMLDDIIYGATNEGSRCATGNRMVDYAVLQLERNRAYIVAEIDAYIDSTYTTTVTAATAATDVFTCTSTAWMTRNAAIRFTGTVFGGVDTITTYYVQNVVSATTFKIATARDSATPVNIASNASGSMTVALYYSSTACLRDVNTYIDALKYDLKYPGNYKSRYAARYYANSVTGSLEEDMYYLRDSTGVRDMTLQGLTGDLLAPNDFSTSRVSAGAYCSLDAGWGPEDYRTWIITRSPYVQGVTTLGTACVGQKIDGALHNGGNDSITSNDFTQVLSDGIGAWVTNNGRAELVSVFTYYNHIGYLAENGGRIRATNGNNSYGDFGAVAEGFDTSETPNTAVIDNQSRFVATADVSVDGTSAIGLEFHNAGSDYSEATGAFSGQSGNVAVAEFDEFRDDAVFQVRLTTTGDDSSGQFGGNGFVTSEGTAQGGSSTSITISATDGNTSATYVGSKIVLDGGAGRGQFAIIQSYNSGTKIANVVKESTGAAGFDHFLPGSTITAPNSSTTYIIEPALSFTAPGYTSTAVTLPTSGDWVAVKYGETAAVYTTLTGTYAGTGTGATFTVTRNGWKYTPSLQSAGTGYARLQTITILGTSLGGLTTTNDLVITITAVNSVTGAILDFDHTGYGIGGRYVAIRGSSTVGATSEDGVSWTTRASLMPSAATWSDMAAGILDDGSSIGKVSRFVAVAGVAANTTGAYSEDGITWSAVSMVTSAVWVGVAFGQQRFVAIASDVTTVRIADPAADVIAWNLTGTLSTTGFTAIAYGKNKFVAIKRGSDVTNYATSTTVTGNWSAGIMPSSSNWESIAYGNNRFVAISNTNGAIAAYSLDGITWTASTLPATADWYKITYGQGVFLAVSESTVAATSPDGITWTIRATSTAASGFNSITFGNPNRYGLFVGVGAGGGTQVATYIRTGATTKGRAAVADEKIFEIRITEPGSGYSTAPTMTVIDPNNIFEVPHTVRLGKSALGIPSFIDSGTGYSTGDVVIAGDGYADNLQSSGVIAVRQLSAIPKNGSNIVFAHLPDRNFKLVAVTGLLGGNDGSRRAFFQVSPVLQIFEAPDNGVSLETRIRFSQTRMTGHDFLDIGTGNFAETNYPGTPTQDAVPANETVESGGGRVFFTTTDQDGNFRVGDLFSIEQSTGVATLNADAFNISGLQELSLGEFTLGGGSATITEFSTDPFFTANSDSVIPTQRAIKSYIASQIGGGGASLNVNSIIAGTIQISGSTITTTGNETITMNARFNFRDGITGIPLAFNYFFY